MRQWIRILALFSIVLLVHHRGHGQNAIDDYSFKIDSLIQTTQPRRFNGVILITQNGKVKYSKASGYSDFSTNKRLTLKDNFRIQSNSKQITAVLILKEVEKGNLVLDKSVKSYLTDLKQPWADTVTVHQLLVIAKT